MSDELLAELDARFKELKSVHEEVLRERDALRSNIAAANAATEEASSLARTNASRIETLESALRRAELSAVTLRDERDAFSSSADVKQKELDRLSGELTSRSEALVAANATAAAASAEVCRVEAELRHLQLTSARLAEEKTLALTHKANAEAEAEQAREAVNEVRRRAASERSELLTNLENERNARISAEALCSAATTEADRARAEVAVLLSSQREAEASHVRIKDGLERQLATQAALSAQYAASRDKLVEQVTSLELTVESLRTSLRDTKDAAIREKNEAIDTVVVPLQTRIAELEKSLASQTDVADTSPAKRVLESLRADAEAGGGASRTALEILKLASNQLAGETSGGSDSSGTGTDTTSTLSASMLLARAHASEDALEQERAEVAKLRGYLMRVLADIEAKAPLIAQQRRDYERALLAHSEVSERLREALEANGTSAAELDSERSSRKAAEERAEILAVQVSDLSRQVEHLLRRQLVQGGQNPSAPLSDVPWPEKTNELIYSVVSSASTEIKSASAAGGDSKPNTGLEDYLITFSDVGQLQQVNRQLLQVVRIMARHLVKAGGALGIDPMSLAGVSTSTTDKHTPTTDTQPEMSTVLRNMVKELAELRLAREEQASMVSTLIAQRDMYKMLLQQADASGPAIAAFAAANSSQTLSASLADKDSFVSSIQTQYQQQLANAIAEKDAAIAELARVREEAANALRTAEATSSSIRDELSRERLATASAQGEARFQASCAANAKAREEAAVAASAIQANALADAQRRLVAHEKEAVDMAEKLESCRFELANAKAAFSTAEANRALAEAAENRASAALREAMQERDRYARLLDAVGTLDAAASSRGAAAAAAAEEAAAAAAREAAVLRTALDEERSSALRRSELHAAELREVTRRAEAAAAEATALRVECTGLRASLTAANSATADANARLEEVLSRVEGRVAALGARGDVDTGRLGAAEGQLAAAASELVAAREAAAVAARHAAEYKAIADAAEAQLRELSVRGKEAIDAANEAREKANAEMATAKASVEALEADALRKAQAHATAEASWLSREAELMSEIEKASKARVDAEASVSSYLDRIKTLQADSEAAAAALRTASERYEALSQLHAHANSALAAAEARARTAEAASRAARDEAAAATAAQAVARERAAADVAAAAARDAAAREEVTRLKRANADLHSLMETLFTAAERAKVGEAASILESDTVTSETSVHVDENAPSSPSANTGSGIQQLRSVIAYLRSANGILESRAELAEQRVASANEAAIAARRELDEARAAVAAAREAALHATSANVQPLSDNLSQLALLRESNTTLRAEAAAAAARAEAATKRAELAEANAAPLSQRVLVLEAEVAAAAADAAQRATEVAQWRARLESVLSRHDAIDPVEHKALVESAAATAAKLAELEKTVAESETIRTRLAEAEASVASINEKLEKFKSAARQWKSRHDSTLEENKSLREAHAKEIASFEETKKAAIDAAVAKAIADAASAASSGVSTTTGAATNVRGTPARIQAALEAARKELADAKLAHTQALAEVTLRAENAEAASLAATKRCDELAAELKEAQTKLETADTERKELNTKFSQLKELFKNQKSLLKVATDQKAELEEELKNIRAELSKVSTGGTGTVTVSEHMNEMEQVPETSAMEEQEQEAAPSPPFMQLRPPSVPLESEGTMAPFKLLHTPAPSGLPVPTGVSRRPTPAPQQSTKTTLSANATPFVPTSELNVSGIPTSTALVPPTDSSTSVNTPIVASTGSDTEAARLAKRSQRFAKRVTVTEAAAADAATAAVEVNTTTTTTTTSETTSEQSLTPVPSTTTIAGIKRKNRPALPTIVETQEITSTLDTTDNNVDASSSAAIATSEVVEERGLEEDEYTTAPPAKRVSMEPSTIVPSTQSSEFVEEEEFAMNEEQQVDEDTSAENQEQEQVEENEEDEQEDENAEDLEAETHDAEEEEGEDIDTFQEEEFENNHEQTNTSTNNNNIDNNNNNNNKNLSDE